MAELLVEVGKGIGRFFLHPILYFSILWVIGAGYIRMKRERQDFRVRVHEPFLELKTLFPFGLLAGLLVSILTLAIGLIIPIQGIWLIAGVTILLTLIGNARFLSPAFTIGLPLLFFVCQQLFTFSFPNFPITHSLTLSVIALLLGGLILTEGILIIKDGTKTVSPKLRQSRRGLTVGAMQAKRFWLIPVFLLLPTGSFIPTIDWWPVVQWGAESYSFILVPFFLGYQHQIQTTIPSVATRRIGSQVLLLGIVVLVGGVVSFLEPVIISLVTGVIALIGRLGIAYRHRIIENQQPYYYAPRNEGLMILDILPNSPAERMGLKTGEVIRTCNKVDVNSEEEFYYALLKNRAYCKLEVFDTNGEIRLVQSALYEDDHHDLGILFIERKRPVESSRVM